MSYITKKTALFAEFLREIVYLLQSKTSIYQFSITTIVRKNVCLNSALPKVLCWWEEVRTLHFTVSTFYSKNKVFHDGAMATRPIASREASDQLSLCFTGGLYTCNRLDLFGMP